MKINTPQSFPKWKLYATMSCWVSFESPHHAKDDCQNCVFYKPSGKELFQYVGYQLFSPAINNFRHPFNKHVFTTTADGHAKRVWRDQNEPRRPRTADGVSSQATAAAEPVATALGIADSVSGDGTKATATSTATATATGLAVADISGFTP